MNKPKQFGFLYSEKTYRGLKKLAFERDVPISYLIRKGIKYILNSNDKSDSSANKTT